MFTPILQLESHIASCAFLISPGKSEELKDATGKKNLSILFTDDSYFSIRVNVETGEVKLPVGSLNYLWCSTYLFQILYNAYVAAQGSGAKVLDTKSKSTLNEAIELFNWSLSAMNTGKFSWPLNKPYPSLTHEEEDNIHVTNELFLAALAWIIHHERAHVWLEHSNVDPSDSVRQEKEADTNATEWVMHACANELERQKRAFGIAIAVLAMALVDNPRDVDPDVITHPPSAERLFENIDIAGLSEDNIVYAFCTVVLQFCIGQYTQAPAADGAGDSMQEIFTKFLIEYRTRLRKGSEA